MPKEIKNKTRTKIKDGKEKKSKAKTESVKRGTKIEKKISLRVGSWEKGAINFLVAISIFGTIIFSQAIKRNGDFAQKIGEKTFPGREKGMILENQNDFRRQGNSQSNEDNRKDLELIFPAGDFSVRRGGKIDLIWKFQDSFSNETVEAEIKSEKNSKRASFKAEMERGYFYVDVPPGKYSFLITTGEYSKILSVEVLGSEPKINFRKSSFFFDGYSQDGYVSEIVDDGNCSASAVAYLLDDFGYPVAGKEVLVTTDRPENDVIVANDSSSNQYGEVRFFLTSKKNGESKITAKVDGREISNGLVLKVSSVEKGGCYGEK